MNKPLRQWISPVLYVLATALLLTLCARPIRDAVRNSGTAVFPVLLYALGAAALGWLGYAAVRRRHPPLPALGYGALCLLAVVVILYDALPVLNTLKPALADLGGLLVMAALLLFSFWFAGRPSRPAHAVSVGLRILYCVILFAMAWQIIREIEVRSVTLSTWITAGILAAGIPAFFAPRIAAALRRRSSYRKADHVAIGRIYQIIGETHLDMDGDPVTNEYALIRYEADGAAYETRAEISRYAVRRFGKDAFTGREIPVFYDPADPAGAFADRIDRHFFDGDRTR